MTEDDVLFGFRLRLFTLAEELGNISQACRAMASLDPPTTTGSQSCSATASTACGSGSAANPACPTGSASTSSTASSPSPWETRASGPGASPRSSPGPKWGRHQTLRERRLVRAQALQPQHPLQTPGADCPHANPHERAPEVAPKERHIDASEPDEKVQMDLLLRGSFSSPSAPI
jgi:hypothetical protein